MLSSNRVARGGGPALRQLLPRHAAAGAAAADLLPAAAIGLDVPSWVAAIAGMSLCTAAYQAEIMRGGFAGVPRGLVEAADMCGMSRFDTFRRIRLPIAFKLDAAGADQRERS